MLAVRSLSHAMPVVRQAASHMPTAASAHIPSSMVLRTSSQGARLILRHAKVPRVRTLRTLTAPKLHKTRVASRLYSSTHGPQRNMRNESEIHVGGGSNPIEMTFSRIEKEGNTQAAQSTNGRMNTVINICPQQEVWIVERLGKYKETVGGGLNFYIPFVDSISYRFSMKEQALIIPSRSAITKDNVRIHCVGVLYYKILDPYQAAYGCGDPVFSLSQLAQTSLRSVIGKLTLDETFHERSLMNSRVVETCNDAAKVWGITCLRHEIREIQPPENVLHAMEMQMEAERKKRVDILQSEGEQQAIINRAEVNKREKILQSEATKTQAINIAEGDAASVLIQAQARKEAQRLEAEGAALALERIAVAMSAQGGSDAVQFELALKYIDSFSHMASKNNTMIVPSNVADLSSMLAQATAVIKKVQSGTNTPL